MRTGKVLFWLGIVVMVLELIFYIRTLILIPHSLTNAGVAIGSPVWQGGTLIGIGKIIEKLYSKPRSEES